MAGVARTLTTVAALVARAVLLAGGRDQHEGMGAEAARTHSWYTCMELTTKYREQGFVERMKEVQRGSFDCTYTHSHIHA